jgi:hypothetical protein
LFQIVKREDRILGHRWYCVLLNYFEACSPQFDVAFVLSTDSVLNAFPLDHHFRPRSAAARAVL